MWMILLKFWQAGRRICATNRCWRTARQSCALVAGWSSTAASHSSCWSENRRPRASEANGRPIHLSAPVNAPTKPPVRPVISSLLSGRHIDPGDFSCHCQWSLPPVLMLCFFYSIWARRSVKEHDPIRLCPPLPNSLCRDCFHESPPASASTFAFNFNENSSLQALNQLDRINFGCHFRPAANTCYMITPPDSGRFVRAHQGTVLMAECNPGYVLVGSRMLYCDGDEWNGTAPICKGKKKTADRWRWWPIPEIWHFFFPPSHQLADWNRPRPVTLRVATCADGHPIRSTTLTGSGRTWPHLPDTWAPDRLTTTRSAKENPVSFHSFSLQRQELTFIGHFGVDFGRHLECFIISKKSITLTVSTLRVDR